MDNIYDEICCYQNIKWSFNFLGKKNKRPGPDGIRWEDILEDETNYLNELVQELRARTYVPDSGVIRIKPYYPGAEKLLYYTELNIREKIVEYAIKRCLYPKFEEIFMDFSCAYRKGKGEKYVTQLIQKYTKLGDNWFVSLDIKSFFSSISQIILIESLTDTLKDVDVVDLIKKCLGLNNSFGIPAGHVLSPLISNFYLNKVDVELNSRNIRTIRYADNYCFAANTKEALRNSKEIFLDLLAKYSLTLNENKTKIVYQPKDYSELII